MDPYGVLGVDPEAPPEAVSAAYRRLAKRWHPDRAGGDGAARMAQINAAYDLLRAGAVHRRASARPRRHAPVGAAARQAPAASWLAPHVRRALGPELRAALRQGEQVVFVVPVATWASPEAILAVTDRRLVWLLGDAISARVRSLALAQVAEVSHRLSWPRRRTAVLRVRTAGERTLSFAELRPATAAAIAAHVDARRRPRGRAEHGPTA